jgi:hypothetical protein
MKKIISGFLSFSGFLFRFKQHRLKATHTHTHTLSNHYLASLSTRQKKTAVLREPFNYC